MSLLRWHEVTAVFGGTFDPPHLGHREAVRGLFSTPGVQRVLVIPSPSPPHKPCFASPEHRIEMARRCFSPGPSGDFPREVTLDLRELERAQRKPGQPTYSFDTLQELRRDYEKLAFVIGTDQLAKLPTWNRFPELLGLSHWIVLDRKAQAAEAGSHEVALKTLRDWTSSGLVRPSSQSSEATWLTRFGTTIQWLPTIAPALSSTRIRETIAKTGQPPAGTLSTEVLDYLKLHRIYGTSRDGF